MTKRVKEEEREREMDGEGKRGRNKMEGRWRKQIADKRASLVFQRRE